MKKMLILCSSALLFTSCQKDFSGEYQTFHMHKVVKDNDYAVQGNGYTSQAIYKDFAPLKLSLSKSDDSYTGNVEIFSTQTPGMFGPTDDTTSKILEIKSTSLIDDTLKFVFSLDAGWAGEINLKGFLLKEGKESVLAIDAQIMEDLSDSSMNPMLMEANDSYFIYKTGGMSDKMLQDSYTIQKASLERELAEASRYSKDRYVNTIAYFDSLLIQ